MPLVSFDAVRRTSRTPRHCSANAKFQLNWNQLLSFSLDIVEGINVLHDMNIVHRDLKSLNILVSKDWKLKVGDFGLSRVIKPSNIDTLSKVCGTVTHCAPELFSGNCLSTQKSDVFSMGIIFWELLSTIMNNRYKEPYSEYGHVYDYQLIFQAANGLRPNIPTGSPNIYAQLYLDCVKKDPEERPISKDVKVRLAEMIDMANQDSDKFFKRGV